MLKGDRLIKVNLTSGGVLKKYFKVIGNNQIRWGKKEIYLANTSNSHSYMLSEIRGIIYGKCTRPFMKKSREKFESWLCFSLIIRRRSLDIYCTEDQINDWYIGLTELAKLQNKSLFCLSKGKFFWRKFFLVLHYAVMMSIPKEQKRKMKKNMSDVKALIIYGEILKKK